MTTAIDAGVIARVLGIKTTYKNLRGGQIIYLPQRVAVIGQGASASVYSNDKRQVTSAQETGELYGFGSPVYLAVKELLPVNGDGVGTIPVTVYPLDDDGAGVVSTGGITPSGPVITATSIIIRVNNIDSEPVVLTAAMTVAQMTAAMETAINAVLDMPIIAVDGTTVLNFTSKWQGASANGIVVEVIELASPGITFAITQPVGGANNPDVDSALNLIGNVWETMVLNCMDIADTTTLDKYAVVGEVRWGALVRKPFVVFTGNTATTVAAAIAVPDARKTDRTNAQLVAPGSNNLPLAVAARQLARIAVIANNNPPTDYGNQAATGLVPGADSEQWTFTERDTAVKAGSSTIEVKDGVINISDVVTFQHPDGELYPAYRYVVDIVKLQNILFNLDLIFATPEWSGAPLLPDDQATTNPLAKKPKSARAAISDMIDSLALEAIISKPAVAKDSVVAAINGVNPKRLDVELTVQLSGNSNVISIDFNFGFFFGSAA